jgi:hypothetical protein
VGTTRGWSQQVERGAMVERTGDTVEWHALLTTSVKGVGRGSRLGDQEQLGQAKGGGGLKGFMRRKNKVGCGGPARPACGREKTEVGGPAASELAQHRWKF